MRHGLAAFKSMMLNITTCTAISLVRKSLQSTAPAVTAIVKVKGCYCLKSLAINFLGPRTISNLTHLLFRVYSRYIRLGVSTSLWEFIWGI